MSELNNNIVSIAQIIDLISNKFGIERAIIEKFVRALLANVENALINDGVVILKGLGRFQKVETIDVEDETESYNVLYNPDDDLRKLINLPFAHLETITLNVPDFNENKAYSQPINETAHIVKKEPMTVFQNQAMEIKEILSEIGMMSKSQSADDVDENNRLNSNDEKVVEEKSDEENQNIVAEEEQQQTAIEENSELQINEIEEKEAYNVDFTMPEREETHLEESVEGLETKTEEIEDDIEEKIESIEEGNADVAEQEYQDVESNIEEIIAVEKEELSEKIENLEKVHNDVETEQEVGQNAFEDNDKVEEITQNSIVEEYKNEPIESVETSDEKEIELDDFDIVYEVSNQVETKEQEVYIEEKVEQQQEVLAEENTLIDESNVEEEIVEDEIKESTEEHHISEEPTEEFNRVDDNEQEEELEGDESDESDLDEKELDENVKEEVGDDLNIVKDLGDDKDIEKDTPKDDEELEEEEKTNEDEEGIEDDKDKMAVIYKKDEDERKGLSTWSLLFIVFGLFFILLLLFSPRLISYITQQKEEQRINQIADSISNAIKVNRIKDSLKAISYYENYYLIPEDTSLIGNEKKGQEVNNKATNNLEPTYPSLHLKDEIQEQKAKSQKKKEDVKSNKKETAQQNTNVFERKRIYDKFITTVTLESGSRLRNLARQYYGDSKFWVYIYEANKERIKDPNVVSVGSRIKIPELDKKLIDKNNPQCLEYASQLENKYLK